MHFWTWTTVAIHGAAVAWSIRCLVELTRLQHLRGWTAIRRSEYNRSLTIAAFSGVMVFLLMRKAFMGWDDYLRAMNAFSFVALCVLGYCRWPGEPA